MGGGDFLTGGWGSESHFMPLEMVGAVFQLSSATFSIYY